MIEVFEAAMPTTIATVPQGNAAEFDCSARAARSALAVRVVTTASQPWFERPIARNICDAHKPTQI